MSRPQIRPPIFVALQNGLAALIFTSLYGAEMVRRLLDDYPQSELLWRLSTLANRTVMPVLQYAEHLLPTPEKLIIGLAAGMIIPLLAWWTRYWFVTALAGHLSLAALVIITFTVFRRGHLALLAYDVPNSLQVVRPNFAGYGLIALTLFVFVMCIADHVAFVRHLAWLWKKFARRA